LGYNLCMSTPILVTKLFVPTSRSEHLPRPRLLEQLTLGLNRKLTLISAPAGFGKTTLVTEWINHLQTDSEDESQDDIKLAWLSLDEHDNDPVRFLSYFITALNRNDGIDAELGVEALKMLQSPQPLPPETILTSLINDAASLDFKIILVLDDYHLIDNLPIHETLDFFIENQPPQFHLVITTREDPLLSLSRLRVRGQVTELRAADLCFNSIEVADFLTQVMGLGLASSDISVLAHRTEGWIAGLQLAALSLKGRDDTSGFIQSFAGSNRLVLDYLIDEVLDQQNTDLQNFLLQTSVLERLIGPLCDAVRFSGTAVDGMKTGQEILEILDRANLFIIPLDEERCWYRYHHLFADLLRQRLQQTNPELLPTLHQRASRWYADQGFGEAAIDHALLGADFDRAAALIDQHVGSSYEVVSPVTLQRWLGAIPTDMLCDHPQLCLLQAWNQFTSGQLAAADESLRMAAETLERAVHLSNPVRNTLSGRARAIRGFIASYTGDLPKAVEYAQQALDVLPAEEAAWRSAAQITLGDSYAAQGQITAAHQIRTEALEISKSSGDPFIQMIAQLNLAETIWQQGDVKQVGEICAHQAHQAKKQGLADTATMGWLYGLWGTALAEMNQLEQAAEYTLKGVELTETSQDIFYVCYSNLHRVRVLFAMGDYEGVQAIESKLKQTALDYDLPQWAISQIAAWQVCIWLAQEDLAAATEWVNDHGIQATDDFPFVQEPAYVALARVRLAQGALPEAYSILDRLQTAAELGGRDLRRVEVKLLQALVAQTDGDVDQALTFLESALHLAQKKRIVQTFVNEGPAIARLLFEAVKQEIEPIYAQHLIAAFPVATPDPALVSKSEADGWVEPLTEREAEILQHIAKGLTNREIGNRLYLSANTIKAHARTIYSKLEVNNRTQAVNRARSLGLISDS
jgi:LuxR family maltose regulon positive regulatory protein